ncbi:MAG: DUF429 domain-containing protein [Micrococcus sp.]|nr:DUF429 domain-containing protein [Micrococcus sp.]
MNVGATGLRRFVGVDLAAAPERTGLAVLVEVPADGTLRVERAMLGADDDEIVGTIGAGDRAGVDVPFGWPESFVRFIAAHSEGTVTPVAGTGPDWRRSLALRATDLAVRELTGLNPLSVSTDRIAYPALRWANLAARLRAAGHPVAPDGGGPACEVYPAAALRAWGLPHRVYKKDAHREARAALVEALEGLLPWLDFNGYREACLTHDDVLDAVLSALVAREVHRGRTHRPPPDLLGTARREGWIHVPAGPPSPPASPEARPTHS